jgi:hypothetical protein
MHQPRWLLSRVAHKGPPGRRLPPLDDSATTAHLAIAAALSALPVADAPREDEAESLPLWFPLSRVIPSSTSKNRRH